MQLSHGLRFAVQDWGNRQGAALLVRARSTALVGSVLLGALLALTLAGHAEPYLQHYYGR
jgi:hypothetical protein